MLNARTVHPAELTHDEVSAWTTLVAAEPAFGNPLLGPDFAIAVGAVRSDARVTVYRDGETIVGFLPHHRRPGGMARPLGAPLSDYHGLIAGPHPDLTADRVLALAGVSAWRFTGLVDPYGVFAQSSIGETSGYAVTLTGPAADYLESLRAASPKRFKNWRRLDSKLEREVGPVRIEASDDPAVYDQIMDWKREQLIRTGVADFLRPDWTRALLANLAAARGPLRGITLTMWAGDTIAAGHFGVAQNGWYHPWVASTNPDLAEYSPGQTFLMKAIAAMPDLGLTTYDLGPSHDHYKRHYAAPTQVVGEGTAAASTPAGVLAGGRERAWTLAGARRDGMVASLRRRLDAIAVTELSTVGRVRGFVEAVAAQPRRRLAMAEGE
ncbi:MAG: GNAT family N-acetyltransferase [Caulobacter sp.]|nr:GNAT family N-acetyltransferase [Caulobacter sp.]